jgi:hypothetical protein
MSKLSETPLSEHERAALTEAMLINESRKHNYAQFGVNTTINGKATKGFLMIDHSPLLSRGSIFGAGVLSLPVLAGKAKSGSLLERVVKFNQDSLGFDPDRAWASMGLSEGMDTKNFNLATLRSIGQYTELTITRTFIAEARSDPNLEHRQLLPSDHNLETLFKGFNDFVAGLKTALPVQQITVLPAKL